MNGLRFAVMVAGAIAAGAVLAQSGADVVKAKGCLGCHAVDQKKVGPSFKDIAAKKGDAADVFVIADQFVSDLERLITDPKEPPTPTPRPAVPTVDPATLATPTPAP